MGKKEIKEGIIIQKHPDHYIVELKDGGEKINAYCCGKMRKNHIKILEGDEVRVAVSEYGERGIIKYRN